MSELVVPALQAVSTAGGAYPPLRSAASSALWIANTVKVHIHQLRATARGFVLKLFVARRTNMPRRSGQHSPTTFNKASHASSLLSTKNLVPYLHRWKPTFVPWKRMLLFALTCEQYTLSLSYFSAVDTISRDVRTCVSAKSLIKRFRSSLKDRNRIQLYTSTMDRAFSLFNVRPNILRFFLSP